MRALGFDVTVVARAVGVGNPPLSTSIFGLNSGTRTDRETTFLEEGS